MPGSSPVVLTFGLRPERLLDAESRTDAFVEVPQQEHGEILVEAIASGIEAGGHVIAIVPAWFDREGFMRVQMAQSILDTGRVAVHRTVLPPLAATVLASMARPSAPTSPAPACSPRCSARWRPSCASSPGWAPSAG